MENQLIVASLSQARDVAPAFDTHTKRALTEAARESSALTFSLMLALQQLEDRGAADPDQLGSLARVAGTLHRQMESLAQGLHSVDSITA